MAELYKLTHDIIEELHPALISVCVPDLQVLNCTQPVSPRMEDFVQFDYLLSSPDHHRFPDEGLGETLQEGRDAC